MPAGRPRLPTEAKILKGTFRKDRDSGGVSASGVPKPPDYLEGDALAFWKSVVPGLVEARVVAAIDSHQLGMMCWWYSEARSLMRAAAEAKKNKLPGLAPYVPLGICTDKFDRLACRFGLTPSDRAKLKADVPASPAQGVVARKRAK